MKRKNKTNTEIAIIKAKLAIRESRENIKYALQQDAQKIVFNSAMRRPSVARKILYATATTLLREDVVEERGIKSRLAHIVKDTLGLRDHYVHPNYVGYALDDERVNPKFGYIVVTDKNVGWVDGGCSLILYA